MSSQGKNWLHFIIDEFGKSYRKDMGLVIAKASRKPLKYDPIGWQDIQIAWERDLEKWGVNRNFTLPYGFVLDGADIIRSLFYKGNFEQKIYLLIQKQYLFIDSTNYYYYYDLFYKGLLDFTTVSDEEDKVSISINEGGLVQDLKANTGTVYEIPCDEIAVRMDGVLLQQSASYIVTNGTLLDNLGGHTIGLSIVGSEGITSLGAIPENRVKTNNNAHDLWATRTWFLVGGVSDTIAVFTWDFHVLPELASGISPVFGTSIILQLITLADDTVESFTELQFKGGGSTALLYGQDQHFQGTATATIQAGRRAVLYMSANNNRDFTFFKYTTTNSSFTAKYDYLHPTTYVKAVYLYTLMKRLVGKMTGDEANAVSALLEQFKNVVVISGNSLRGIPDAVIKTKFDDFFQSVNAILNVGQGVVNKKILIESKDFFLQETDVIPLGEVKEITVKMATELLVNTVKIGYPDPNIDSVNGKQAFNTTHIYSSPVKKVVKELDLTSVYEADPFLIETIRIDYDGKTTTDATSDNNNYFLSIGKQIGYLSLDNTPTFELKRVAYDTITGLIHPETAFNIEDLTPARMLAKHKPYLNSIFYGFEGLKLIYETSTKNSELYTKKGTDIFDEDADYVIDGTNRLFKPFTFDLKPQTPVLLVETLEANPNRCFSFVHYNSKTYTGFNIKLGIAANTLEEQAYLLLSTNSNDLTTLI